MKLIMKKVITSLALAMSFYYGKAQQKDLLNELSNDTNLTQKVTGAFKSTRVINAHSTEMLAKKSLDVRICHRFGLISLGPRQFYGLDIASMRLGFDYGITNNLMVGLGRSTFRKELDGFAKLRLLQQATGYKAVPVSILLAGGATVWTEQSFDSVKPRFADRSACYLQLIIGKKFTRNLSLQFSPIVINSGKAVNSGGDPTVFALGGGGRFKITRRMALTLDYHHPLGKMPFGNKSPLSAGIDIETGGHVFQLHFSNTAGMNERAYITQTTGDFFKGDIRLGFNLSRMFYLGKKAAKW